MSGSGMLALYLVGLLVFGAAAAPSSCADTITGGCSGMSPNQQRWFLLQPQHSGTGTLCNFFHDQLNVTSCKHAHTPPHRVCVSDFSVILAANPFRRLISSAAWHGVISGGRRILPWKYDEDLQVAHFRAWIQQLSGAKKLPNQFTLATDALAALRGRNASFVLRTNQLQADTLLLLDTLGYPRKKFTERHCVSGCEHGSTERYVAASDAATLASDAARLVQRSYYDRVTARKAVRLMQKDFAAFGFSKDPARMFD